MRVFEKILIGGFSCVNTRLTFDTDILIKNPKTEKVLVETDVNGQKQLKRFSSKILKMDENNQYGQAMTKPLPYGQIRKEKEVPTIKKFNEIIYSIDHVDNIGHLFTVDIKFTKINEKTLLFNEIYPPILKKNKKIDPYERSTLQVMSVMSRDDDKNKIKLFHTTLKLTQH